MGIQINGQTDTVTSTTAGGSVKVTPLAASTGLNVGTGASISSPTTNVLTLGTNNVESVRISSSGNIGVGTNNPTGNGDQTTIHVHAADYPVLHLTNSTTGTAASDGSELTLNADGSLILRNRENSFIRFDANGSERARVSAAGSFAVGTSAAISNLVTTGAPSTNWRPQLAFQYSSGTQAEAFVGCGSNAHNIWVTAGAEPSNDPDVSNWAIARSTVAAIYRQRDASHRWFTDTSLTSGNTYTPTERARIDSSGRFLLGATSARTSIPGGDQGLLIEGTSSTNSQNRFTTHVYGANDSQGPYLGLGKTRSTSIGGNTIVQSGDEFGGIYFHGSDGSTLRQGAYILCVCDGTPGAADMPGRLVFATTRDGASSPTEAMRINNTGTVDVYTPASGNYAMRVLPGSGADRSILLAGIGGVTNGFRADWVNSSSQMAYRFTDSPTTAAGANAHLDSGDNNRLYRSTSSLRYKKDIEDIEQNRADAVLNLRPVWYRSKSSVDPNDWSWYGLIAEEVAEIEPRLVQWTYLEEDYSVEEVDGQINKTLKEGAQKVPDGVQYDRLGVLLLDVVKRQQQAIETLQAEVAELKTKVI